MSTVRAATLSVDIDINAAQAVQALRAVEQAGKQAAAALKAHVAAGAAGVAASSRQVVSSMQRQQDEMLKTAQAEARLAAASRNYAQAIAILEQALAQVTVRTRQAISAEAQLARMMDYSAKQTQSLSEGMRKLTNVGNMLVNTLGAVGASLGLSAAVQYSQQMIALANEVERTRAALEAIAGSTQVVDHAMRVAAQNQQLFGGSLAQNVSIMQQFLMISRRTGASIDDLVETARLLSVVNPMQGLEGAAFALSEVFAGDVTSIVERFNLSRQLVKQILAEAKSGEDIFRGIQRLLAEQGVTTQALAQQLDTTAQKYIALGAAAEQAAAKIGSSLAQAFEGTAVALTFLLNQFTGAETVIDQVNQRLLTQSSSYEAYVAAVARANEAIQEYNNQAFALSVDTLPKLTEAQYVYLQALLQQGYGFEEALNKAQAFGFTMEYVQDGLTIATERSTALAEAKAMLEAAMSHAAFAAEEERQALAALNVTIDDQIQSLYAQAVEKINAQVQSEQLAQAQRDLEQALKAAAATSGDVRFAVQQIVQLYGIEEAKVYELIQAYQVLEAARARAERQQQINAARTAMLSERIAEREQVYAKRELERQKEEEARQAARGGRGRASRAVRTESQEQRALEREQRELAEAQERIIEQTERFEQRLLDIRLDYARRMREAERRFADEQIEGRADFYNRLASIEDNALRQQLSAQYEAAVQRSQAIAEQYGADVAEKYLQEQTKIILAQYERQQRIAEAMQKGDIGLAEYLKGVDELYRQAEQRRLETLLSGEGSLARQQQEAIAELEREYGKQAAEAVTAEQAKREAIVATNAALREQVELMRATATSSRATTQPVVPAAQGMTTGQQIAQPIAPTLPAFPDQEQIAEKIDVPLSVMLDRLERALQDVRGAIERLRLVSPVAV